MFAVFVGFYAGTNAVVRLTSGSAATCTGVDDGAGAACALNAGSTACAVDGGDCVFADASPGVWPYPSVQEGLRGEKAVLLYGSAGAMLVVLCVLFRIFNAWLWRVRILREINHARTLSVHRETNKGTHGGW